MTVNRVTKIIGEAVTKQDAQARITQLSGEVATQSNPENRVSQLVGEAVYSTTPTNRVTQIAVEVIALLSEAKVMQVSMEVIEDINPVNAETLKLCLPFDDTVGESFTVDNGPSVHPVEMTTSLSTIESTPAKFGGGAADLTGNDWLRIILPQPDFNFTGDFTIEFWVFKNVSGALEDIMGQWPSTADKGWRIRFSGTSLQFEWTPDGSTVNTESIVHDVPISTWTHLAFENFGGIFTIYSNGSAIYNAPSFVPIHASNADLFVGKVEDSTPGNEFDGSIDEFRIKVGEAVFQAPFFPPSASVDCVTIIPDISWVPGNLGEQWECDSSEFQIIVTGLETVIGLQSFTANGLPDGMVIDSNGNIFGHLPVHDSPPATMTYEFQVTFFVGGVAFLGPDTFSFDVKDRFADDILQVTVPAFFDEDNRTAWKLHLVNLIPNDNQFLPAGDDFGITLTPRLFIMDGLTEDNLTAFQTAMTRFDPAIRSKVIIKTLKFATNGRFDVLYYTIEDRGSDILSFVNPLGIRDPDPIENPNPATIEPLSINNIRDLLETGVGFDSQYGQELLPDWLSTYEPLVIAAFVIAGKGQAIVDAFDNDAIHHEFKGRTIVIDRLDIRRCSTVWPENGEERLTIKFDDIE